MDNREWQTFVTVVDEGNITRAAEKLFLSQPALSYRLRHMEKALGHSLLSIQSPFIAYYQRCVIRIRIS